jgi:hypothetical protein
MANHHPVVENECNSAQYVTKPFRLLAERGRAGKVFGEVLSFKC